MSLHPLTRLVALLIGLALGEAADAVLVFVAQVFSDFARFGWVGEGALDVTSVLLSLIGAFAHGFALGFTQRWLVERSWTRAALWATGFSLVLLVLRAGAPVPSAALGVALLVQAAGALAGAWYCERESWRPSIRDGRELFRSWLPWER